MIIKYLIERPSPFASLTEWKKFLKSLHNINDPDDPLVKSEIEYAQDLINEIQAKIARGEHWPVSESG